MQRRTFVRQRSRFPGRRHRLNSQRGAILFDAMIAMSILVLGALSIYRLIPTVNRSQTFAMQQSRACQLATRMVESIQMLPASSVSASTLTQLQLVDPGQTGDVLSFSNTPLDESTRYSPATALPKGTGTITLTNLGSKAIEAKVVISWTSPFGVRSYTTGTVVGGYR